jgi:lactoylglutathione lyase
MLFMIIEHFRNGEARPVYERFRARGRLAPDGLGYVGSWVTQDLTTCYQVMECDDRALLDQWIAQWVDLVEFEVIPVTTSAEAVARVPAVPSSLEKAFGYQDDAMNLPVGDLDAALPFYTGVLGFRVASRADTPHRSAVLVRDAIRIGLAENGGDPTQDGCAFHVRGLDALLAEFRERGLKKDAHDVGREQRGDRGFRVFYVVAPDGLCYWFGEREAAESDERDQR